MHPRGGGSCGRPRLVLPGAPATAGEGREPSVKERRRGADPRVVASVAIVIAAAAIALEIAYTIGTFAMATVEQFPS